MNVRVLLLPLLALALAGTLETVAQKTGPRGQGRHCRHGHSRRRVAEGSEGHDR